MIKLNKINKVYNNEKKDVIALKEVSLCLPSKGLIHINGKSGSGKSTLLNIIGAISKPTSGKVTYDALSNLNEKDVSWYLRNQYVGFIYQNFNLIEELTVYQNIKISLDILNVTTDVDQIIDKYMTQLNISHLKENYPSEISGGEKQRVAICRILVKGCKVILADEPTGNLDKENAHSVLNILKSLSKDILIVIASHDIELMATYLDYKIDLEKGKLIDHDLIETKEQLETLVSIPNQSIKIKSMIEFGKIISINKSKKRLIFTYLFSLVSLLFIGLLLNLNLLNMNQIQKNIYKDNEISEVIVNDENMDLSNNSSFQEIIKDTSYDDVYSFNDLNFSDIFNYDINPDGETSIYLPVVKSIQISDSYAVDDHEIIITDYLVDSLRAYSYTGISYEIGDQLLIYGHSVTIKDILVTNYSLDKEQIDRHNLNYTYATIYMNQTTYQVIKFPLMRNVGQLSNDNLDFFNIDEVSSSFLDGIEGDHTLSNTDIVVSLKILEDFEIAYDQDVYNKTITLNLDDIDGLRSMSKTYNIKGVVEDYSNTVLFNSSEFLDVSKHIGINIEYQANKQLKIYLNDQIDIELFEYLNAEDIDVISTVSEQVNWAMQFIHTTKQVLSVLTIITVLLSVLFMYFLISINIDQNKKQIGILLSLGLKKMDLVRIIIINHLPIALISAVSSYIALLIVNGLINRYIHTNANIIRIIYSRIDVALYLIIITVVIYIVSSIAPLMKFYKQEIIKLTN